jgi:cell wall-associated NlpC family hydrolase
MQMAQADAALSDAQKILLQQAEAARVASEGNPYTFGGQTIEGFDCSGFVIYVFNQAYGSNTLLRVTAEDLRTEGRFAAVASPGAPCDLIFFSSSAGSSTAAHVGIVVDSTRWIGSQSSTGVAYVSLSNVYWRPRILSYGRYQPLRVAQSIIPSRAGSFASIINPTA